MFNDRDDIRCMSVIDFFKNHVNKNSCLIMIVVQKAEVCRKICSKKLGGETIK